MWILNHRKKAMKITKVLECKRPTANQEYMQKLAKALLLFPMILFLLSGCTDSVEDGLSGSESDPSYYHSTGWKDDPQHGRDFSTNPQNCKACHGEDLEGGRRVYHAQVVIIADGPAPTAKNMPQTLTTAKHVTEMI